MISCYGNPVKIHPERITQNDKKLANNLNYDGVELPVREKDFSKIETKNNIYINVFCYDLKTSWLFQLTIQIKNLKARWIFFLLIDENKSHYVYIKDFDRFMFYKTNNKNQKTFLQELLAVFQL